MRALIAAFSGFIFGVGLVISGMTNPYRVLGFLDVAGDWDPTLAFVMAGAILVAAPAFGIARRQRKALLGDPINLPPRRPVTVSLALGAAIFGVGWGLSGLCPGPAIVLLSTLRIKALVFFAAVLGGTWLAKAASLRSKAGQAD